MIEEINWRNKFKQWLTWDPFVKWYYSNYFIYTQITNILEMSLLAQFLESSSYCWWMFSFWWFHTVPTGNSYIHSGITQTSHRCIADVLTDLVDRLVHRCCVGVQMCFGHDWFWLCNVTMARVMCSQIQNGHQQIYSFSSQLWILSQNMLEYAKSVSNEVFFKIEIMD